MAGISLLSTATLAKIKVALANTMATFAKESVVFYTRSVSIQNFGEQAKAVEVPHPVLVLYEYTKGHAGKYDTVNRTDKGFEEHDGFRLYIWKDDLIAAGIDHIDPEVDQVEFKGKKYRMEMAAPSAQFSDLGELLWEVEVHYAHRN
jgi:hypothetical protein